MVDFNIRNVSPQVSQVNSSQSKEVEETDNNINVFGFEVDEDTLTTILTGVADELFGDGSFTKDEAAIYVAGEKEIDELIISEPNKQNLLETIFDEPCAFGSHALITARNFTVYVKIDFFTL